MKPMSKFRIIVLGLLLSVIAGGGLVVYGQTAPPLVLNPMNDHVQLSPGESYQGSFLITNEGNELRTVVIDLVDFRLTEGGSFKALEEGQAYDYSLSDYVTFSPGTVEIEAGDTAEIRYSIDLPGEARPIPHWSALIVRAEENSETTQQGSESITFQINLNFSYVFALFQHLPGPPSVTGQLDQLTASLLENQESTDLNVEVPFKNTSEAIAEINAYIEIRDVSGDRVYRYDFSPDKLALPQSKRIFAHTFQDVDLDSGRYLVIAVLDYGGSHNLAGQTVLNVN